MSYPNAFTKQDTLQHRMVADLYQIVPIMVQGAFYRKLNGIGMQEDSVCAVVIRKAYISHRQLVAILDEGMTHSQTNS
ncbi:hypothetical protein [Yersinia kristensenii]|uniref:hypothetical protein n=1 Tax=Yersinia kristensenii TaxID=28152 RepID=UPI0015952048|nr:hypothetical protein [Yersinia kristensenii]